MLVLISYDVAISSPGGPRRLGRMARACQVLGQRVQFSVFEIEVTPDQWVLLRARLVAEMDVTRDSLRIYFFGADARRRIEHVAAKPALDFEAPLIV